MPLLRDDDEFPTAIRRAAQKLGDFDPSFVEKDYWVTQVLRALHTSFPNGFTFKGGTSLSKGYGIIERFSEDIDILVVPLADASARDKDAHLRAITAAVAASLELKWEEARAPGRGHDGSRGDLILYQPRVDAAVRVGVGPGAVLLETGYGAGHEPAEMVTITPILCAALGVDPTAYDDTRPFQARALEPRRTLIEKLFALHHIATLFEAGRALEQERFGRHYYDVHRLLDHRSTLTRLKDDRGGFAHLVTDVERIARIRFGGTSARPAEGFAVSPAFTADRSSDLRRWLEGKYEEGLQLLPNQVKGPSFGDVVKRVEQFKDLL